MADMFDVFLSYASADGALADPLVQALKAAGVTVWRDTQRIDSFDHIGRTITTGLTRSKTLLALYSKAYTQRRACDWELAAAYVAGGPERILVLNPEEGTEHIQPQTLRENRFANPADLADLGTLAARIKARVALFGAAFGQLPMPSPDQKWAGLARQGGAQTFVGRRAEIWQVHDGLAAGSVLLAPTTSGTAPGGGSALLRGLGGMGKTLLAEEYARRFAAAWPGGIFWLKAGGPLMDQYLTLAGELGAGFDPADPASLKRAVTDAMAARPGAYLWVVDDLPHGLDAQQARAWFAPTAQGRTLVTTRTRTLDSIAKPVELAELEEDEAFALLTLDQPPKDADEAALARAIIDELGRHALAVDLARHLVRLQGYAKVLDDLRNPDKDALHLAAKLGVELPTGHDKSIAQTFLRSIEMLDATALDALRVAAILAPHTPIPRDLLSLIRLVADDLKPDQAEEGTVLALDQTAAHSLCEMGDSVYVVHALVCRTVGLRHADDRGQALHQASLKGLTALFQQADDARHHPVLAPLIPHARAISDNLASAAQATLAGRLGHYYFAAGLYPTARDLYERVLDARRRILGADHPDTLVSMSNLAATLFAQGDLAGARALQEQELETCRRIQGPDHPDTLTSMNNLAGTMRALGDLLAARKMHEAELEICRRILGPDHPDTLTSMNNLAATLHAQGDLAGAHALEEEVLETRRRIQGPDHPDTLTSMNNLALTLEALGDLAGACEMQQQVLDARHRILGADHPQTLGSAVMLAQYWAESGEMAKAVDLAAWAAQGLVAKLGPDHPHTQMAVQVYAALTALQKTAPAPG
jgi:tetratricopeptide (TPR) repeat protein